MNIFTQNVSFGNNALKTINSFKITIIKYISLAFAVIELIEQLTCNANV
jgi:hypothetical protein